MTPTALASSVASAASLESPPADARAASRHAHANDDRVRSFVRRLNDLLSRKDKDESLLKRLQEQAERQRFTGDDPNVWRDKLAKGLCFVDARQ